ncbi:aminotransferase class V-fold PLP-dependent enzyme [Polymorphobacter fuscus]|uniref:cysteine desulfurase n=1 Tax=Sandarakinorhabdus fusca TaxID=1439888 RepID=A0A7C9KL98_9SPHN|nr:cysteine desulfurase [Polymorphobacter fuscus]KAB7647746.1 cysteine desulfurase [Polymorphobacter fuscus]MQT17043.1 SufS family cysteine desulfurase [Polymorphobacter fuscus]NJC08965.1 cysteine desulfurase/selenocysteine lyase [Polymorphobacter fuscus]
MSGVLAEQTSDATRVPEGSRKADFPGLAGNWAYLDTAATAQKPQVVIDAIARAYGADYATVHRGVYERSATMTMRYEAARETVARFIHAASPGEVVFVRGATEGINLVAQSWGQRLVAGDRVLLSALEHHSNIVPWQMLRDRTGIEIDVAPLTDDGRIDEDALEALLTPRTKLVAIAHVSNVLGGVADVARIARAAHAVGALLLVDGCQAAARLTIDVQAMGADFYVFSGHKLYGPTGIGVLWGRADLLDTMPPVQGGGAMIETVTFAATTYASPPQRFEAGTPAIAEVIGLAAAIDYVESIGLDAIHAHETALVAAARAALGRINSVTLFGPQDSAGILSFAIRGVHPHDIGTILDESGVAIRAGHHCAQPLMAVLGVPATARASFGIYNDLDDVARLAAGIERVTRIFGAVTADI